MGFHGKRGILAPRCPLADRFPNLWEGWEHAVAVYRASGVAALDSL